MPPFRGWTDLPPELLCRIADALDHLKCYSSARGVCTAWRRALPPPAPSLLLLLYDHATTRRSNAAAASLPARRSFSLRALPSGFSCPAASPPSFELTPLPPAPVRTCLGCGGGGWLVLSVLLYHDQNLLTLFHPVTAAEILLPPLIHDTRLLSKFVLAPNPATDDFAVAAICGVDRLAYVTAGAKRWAVLDPVRLACGDQLTDLLYQGNGTVYCLTRLGDVHLLHLPERRRREPVVFEDRTSDLVKRNRRIIRMHGAGPDLNAPATVKPLLASNLPFNAATSFAPPYNTVSAFTSAKNLVFCNGNLYQIWRNASCTVKLKLPRGGHRRVAEDEIFVLRYDPLRRPCWDAVDNLGGYSVFVGKNNAVSMHAQGVPGLKGNCVYWIGGRGRDQGMVFDIETGRSTPCLPPAAGVVRGPQQRSTICWYFLSDIVINLCNTKKSGAYWTRARARAHRAQYMEQ